MWSLFLLIPIVCLLAHLLVIGLLHSSGQNKVPTPLDQQFLDERIDFLERRMSKFIDSCTYILMELLDNMGLVYPQVFK